MFARLQSIFLLAVIGIAPACGSKSEKEEAPKSEESAEKKETGTLDRGKRLFSIGASKTKSLAKEGAELSTSAYHKTRAWGESSVEGLQEEARTILREADGDANAASGKINQLISSLATDPDSHLTSAGRIARIVVLMVPIVGPTKRYIDARELYALGVKEKSEARKQEARREFLIGCAEAGLDIGMLGVAGSQVDLVASGADQVLKLLKISRSVGTLSGTNLKTFDALLDALLLDADVRKSADTALTVDLSL
jgi:hypothetical protein